MTWLDLARAEEEELKQNRRHLHQLAEVGMNLPKTVDFVEHQLILMGYKPKRVGKSGLSAVVGRPGGRTILLRGDMDALPLPEETGLPFACETGNMHACGHDLHTSSLLGAARILKKQEHLLHGQVKFMFQPGEEIMEGAADMLAHGILEEPKVDAAVAIHVSPNSPTGVVATRKENAMASSDMFSIHIQGKGGHGSTPQVTIDPINIGVHIHLALQALISREVNFQKGAALTIGSFQAGLAANIIPDTCEMRGTLRSLHPETRDYLVKRIPEVVEATALTFRGVATVEYVASTPAVYNAPLFTGDMMGYVEELEEEGITLKIMPPVSGSEDFALVAAEVPSTLFMVGALPEGVTDSYPPHHPKVIFDEQAMVISAAVYAHLAQRWLEDNR